MKMVLGLTCSIVLLACGSSTPAPAEAPAMGDAPATGEAQPGQDVAPAGDHAGHAAPGGATAPPGGTSEKCDHLGKTCHAHAGFSALADECHKIGHGGDAAKCEARHDECMAECEKAAKSGAHPHPAGGSGHAPGHH